jgi:hypothetical protein
LLALSERTSPAESSISREGAKAKLVGFKAREPDKVGNPQREI